MSDQATILYGADGRPMKVQAIGWDAAKGSGQKDRVRAYNWTSSSSSINSLLASGGISTVRSRVREAVRNDPVAARAVDVFVSNCISTGIKPLPLVDDDAFRREVIEAWAEWCEEADADNRLDFYGLQSLATRSFYEGGECFVRFRPRRPADGLSTPLQIQLLESEFCDLLKDSALPGGNVVKAGVEFDLVGRRTAYWMFKAHPGDQTFSNSLNAVPVPAAQIAHIFQTLRPGQVRGISALTPVLVTLHELNQFTDAELVRKRLAAMFAAFIETPSVDDDILGAGSVATATDGVELGSLEPGTMQMLPPRHNVRFSEPADVGGSFAAFMSQTLKTIASGLGITYEQLTGDYSEVNFSSVRAGMIEFRRGLAQIQHQVIVHQFCRPIWRRWFETAVLSGRLALPAGMTARQASRVRWITPGWDYVDPQKEIAAIAHAIQVGVMSRDQAIAQRGIDPEELDAEIARGNQRAAEHGLKFDPSVEAAAEVEATETETDEREMYAV